MLFVWYSLHIHAHTTCLRTETRNLRAVQSESLTAWPPPRAPGSQEVPGGFPTFRDCLCTEADCLQHLPTGRKNHEEKLYGPVSGSRVFVTCPQAEPSVRTHAVQSAVGVTQTTSARRKKGRERERLPTQGAPSVPAAISHTPWSDRAQAVGARAL